MMPNILLKILNSRKKSLAEQLKLCKFLESERLECKGKTLSEAVKLNNDISIISEIKPASPSQGDIRKNMNITKIAHKMEQSGAILDTYSCYHAIYGVPDGYSTRPQSTINVGRHEKSFTRHGEEDKISAHGCQIAFPVDLTL